MKVFAVIPAFNEAARIKDTILGVSQFVPNIVVVDDGSADQTADIAKAVGVVVLRHAVNRGQGAALKTGTVAALELGAEAVIHVDADGQHDPESLPVLLGPLEKREADIVFGSRFLGLSADGMPAGRRWLLALARGFNAYALGIPRRVTDPQSGLRAMSAAAARGLNFEQDRMAHCSEILRLATRNGWRWQEVPTRIRYTADSLAKGQKPWDALRIVWQLFIGAFR